MNSRNDDDDGGGGGGDDDDDEYDEMFFLPICLLAAGVSKANNLPLGRLHLALGDMFATPLKTMKPYKAGTSRSTSAPARHQVSRQSVN